MELVSDAIVLQGVLHRHLQLRLVFSMLDLLGRSAIDSLGAMLLDLTTILRDEVGIHFWTQTYELDDWTATSLVLEFTNHL